MLTRIVYGWENMYCVEQVIDDFNLDQNVLQELKEYRPDRVYMLGGKHFVRGDTMYRFIQEQNS